MPRKKDIELNGASFTIAPLTLAQAEAWKLSVDESKKQREENPEQERTNEDIYKQQFKDVICPSLNNALPLNTPDDQKWTPDKCWLEFDMVLNSWLFSEILEFSGYKTKAPDGTPAKGEAQTPST